MCFTKNNYTEDDLQALLHFDRFTYVIMGKEVGESGTPHLQGYAEFSKVTKLAGIGKLFKMHTEVTRGTAVQAIDYCKKDGDWVEKGEARDETGGTQGAAAEKKR